VRHNGQWGSVCDDSFGPQEAAVVCKTLQFDRYVKPIKTISYI
jgi:hypothetical protein